MFQPAQSDKIFFNVGTPNVLLPTGKAIKINSDFTPTTF